MSGFRCLGGACEDTCCAGWTVPIDEGSHRRLRVLAGADPTASKLVDDGIELTPGGASFGKLKLGESGRCVLLDTEGLCQIHARFGVDALFDVCTTYPRYYSEIDGELELFGTLSCPEAARLCLLSNDGFDLVKLVDQEAPRKLRNQFKTDVPYYRPFSIVREATLRALAVPGHILSEKLFGLLWLSNRLSDVLHAKAAPVPLDQLSATLNALVEPEVLRGLGEGYRALAADGSLSFSVIAAVLGDTPDGDSAAAWHHYCRQSDLVTEDARTRIDACLTRYAINHVYTTPYMLHGSLFDAVRELIWRTAVLRYLLTRDLSGFEAPDHDLDHRLVQVVYRFARRLEHSPLFAELGELLERQGMTSFAHTIGFLRL